MKNTERIAWVVITVTAVLWNVLGREKSIPSRGIEPSARVAGHRDTRFPSAAERGGGMRTGRDSANRASLKARTLAALRSDNPLSRTSQFLDLLSSCDAAGFDQILASLDELKASGTFHPEMEALVNFRAGQLNGADLLTGHTGTAEDHKMIGTLLQQYQGWLQADPTAAGQWLDTIPEGKFRDRMAVAYIAATSKEDPVGAMNLVSSLHPSQQASAGQAVVRSLEASETLGDASALLSVLEANSGNDKSPYLRGIFDALVEGAAKAGNQDAFSVLDSHLDAHYIDDSSLARISEAKAKADPVAALEWAATMEDGKQTVSEGALLSATIEGMDLDDLNLAEQWARERKELPGVGAMEIALESRRKILENRGGGENEYDRDD